MPVLVILALLAGCQGGAVRRAAVQGNRLLEQGRLQEALSVYRAAQRQHPEAAVLRTGEGVALYRLERYDEAEAALREAIRLDASDSNEFLYLGHVLSRQKSLPEAAQAYQEATRLDPLDPRGWKALGFTEYNRRRYPQARIALEKYLAFARGAADEIAISQLVSSLPRGAAPDSD
ncbi:MAG: tetratricopeptide repeat protein [Acidobacteriota bacterium]